MKGKLLIAALLGVLLVGSNAFASLARLAVMGSHPLLTDGDTTQTNITNVVNGSMWYDDEYNVFFNPSYILDNKNYVVAQKGLEGGWFSSAFENFAYGVYLNRGNGFSNSKGNVSNLTGMVTPGVNASSTFTGGTDGTTNLDTIRPIDLFFGGDTGVKWGVHFAWAYNRDQTNATAADSDAERLARYYHADLGAQFMGLEPFFGFTFMSKFENTLKTFGKTATQGLEEYTTGLRYRYEGFTPYFAWHHYREAGTNQDTVAGYNQNEISTRMNVFNFGVGHDTKIADGVHLYKNVGFVMNKVEDTTILASTTRTENSREFTHYILPINVALEADATSWLVLRAGLAYDLLNEQKYARLTAAPAASATDKKRSRAGSGTFRVGSTLKLGKVNIDSAFGNGAGATTGTSTTAANLDTNAIGFDSQLFGIVSASYHW